MAWRHTIIWTNAGLLLIGPLGTNFSEILMEILTFSFKKMRLKVSSAKRQPFYLGFNVFNDLYRAVGEDHVRPFADDTALNVISMESLIINDEKTARKHIPNHSNSIWSWGWALHWACCLSYFRPAQSCTGSLGKDHILGLHKVAGEDHVHIFEVDTVLLLWDRNLTTLVESAKTKLTDLHM